MGKFLTSPARVQQVPKKGMYKILDNELYKDDDGYIYLAWRNFNTDNFTWIDSSDWDVRCSHIHDVGCLYHQVVRLRINEQQLRALRLLRERKGLTVCDDIPEKYLEVVKVSGHWINNLFYRMLRNADCPITPKYIQILYRMGVSLNLSWFWTGKKNIVLKDLYSEEWNKC